MGEGPQLGELGQQGAGEGRPDAGYGPQQGLVLAPDGARLDGLLKLAVGAREFLLEPADVGSDAPPHRCGDDGREAVVLGHEHDDELPAPV